MTQVPKPDKSNVCAVVVTYHPDADFPSRLSGLSKQVDSVIIVDNNSNPAALDMLRQLQQHNVHLISNNQNLGVATALNQGMKWARERGYAWLLTMDQDSTVESYMIDGFGKVYDSFPRDRKVGLIGSNYIDTLTGESCLFDPAFRAQGWMYCTTVITSGCLVSLAAADEVGMFRDEFFIDQVDDEYSLRCRRHGFDVIFTSDPLMKHTIGSPNRHRLFGKNLTTAHLPALRRYYMSRNHSALIKEYYKAEPEWVKYTFNIRIKELMLVILFEEHKFKKLYYALLGLLHAIIGRFGRL